MAAQLSVTNGPSRRGLESWMARATSSLPDPLSPRIRTVAGRARDAGNLRLDVLEGRARADQLALQGEQGLQLAVRVGQCVLAAKLGPDRSRLPADGDRELEIVVRELLRGGRVEVNEPDDHLVIDHRHADQALGLQFADAVARRILWIVLDVVGQDRLAAVQDGITDQLRRLVERADLSVPAAVREQFQVAAGLDRHDRPVLSRHSLEQAGEDGLGQVLDPLRRAHVQRQPVKGGDGPVR